MVTKREVLELIASRTKRNRITSYRTLVQRFDLTEGAACLHLKRLWERRLIQSGLRFPDFEFCLEPDESIRDLRFRLTRLGRKKLRWYKDQDETKDSWF